MTAKDIAKQSGCSVSRDYQVAKKLGRLPTAEELANRKNKRGRPIKYKEE